MQATVGPPPARVLVVDDDQPVREILSIVIEREGWVVDRADDGQQAIAHLNEHSYAAIVLDLMMPHGDGITVLGYMKSRGLTTPVVVVSAIANDRTPMLDPNLVRVALQKPFEIGELKLILRAIVQSGSA
ncbi:MAG TPA: response regulator [Thermoanaerobaculia bacterium]|jgi:DNA-binding response OmpR family regulator